MSKPERGWAYAAIGFLFVSLLFAAAVLTQLALRGLPGRVAIEAGSRC